MFQPLPDFNLQNFNTLAVPASARYFAEVQSLDDLQEALTFAKTLQLPLLVLGGGSNIVLEKNFPGLVLHIRLKGIEEVAEDQDYFWLNIGAGENWHDLVQYCLDFHYWGLENLSLIPGSVGAAPIQNIGAYGIELKDVFAELQAVEISSGVVVTFQADACEFGYRDSVFKGRLRDRYIITSVTLKLHKAPRLKLDYPALREQFHNTPLDEISPQQVSSAVCAIRRSKLPDPQQIPNVGSFFKNPVISAVQFDKLQQRFGNIVAFPIEQDRVKLAAGWLIDNAGWRGHSEGKVAVHRDQALVLTNPGKGWGAEVLQLANKIRDSVRDKYGVELEMEPRVYP